MPIAGGFLEFAGAVARGHGLNVLGITLGRLQESGSAREFFRIEAQRSWIRTSNDQPSQMMWCAVKTTRRDRERAEPFGSGTKGLRQGNGRAVSSAIILRRRSCCRVGSSIVERSVTASLSFALGRSSLRGRFHRSWSGEHRGARPGVRWRAPFFDGDIAGKTHRHRLVVGGRQTSERREKHLIALRTDSTSRDGGCGCRALLGGDGRDARPHTTAGF